MPTVEPYEVMMRWNGQTWALHARSLITLDDGTEVEGKPVPLAGLSDPAFTEIAELVSASKDNEIATLTAERDSLQSQLTTMTTERDTALSEKASLQTQLDSANATIETLQARIDELENPLNPFQNSDWQGFRSAALASPVIMRMAVSNIGNFMMLLIYLTEMQKDPATSLKMAAVWNEMETRTPLSPEEITSINQMAAHYQVPMVLNSEGQIVLP